MKGCHQLVLRKSCVTGVGVDVPPCTASVTMIFAPTVASPPSDTIIRATLILSRLPPKLTA